MNTAALWTRGTVWLALVCYVAAIVLQARQGSRLRIAARVLWLAGCVAFLAHVVSAFHFYHHWSHAAAAEDTRQQTRMEIGADFAGGIYFNYLFAAIWLADCAGLILHGAPFHERHRVWRWMLHGYFLFMIFNATVVFGHGLAKPLGAIVCALAVVGLFVRKKKPNRKSGAAF